MHANFFPKLFKEALLSWIDDKAARLGAALAYYTVFSLAPILIIIIAVVGLVYGNEQSRTEVVHSTARLIGPMGAAAAESLIKSAAQPRTGIIASIVGIIALLVGATGAFTELQDDLNLIWRAPVQKSGTLKAFFKQRAISFAMVLGIGMMLVLSIVASTGLSLFSTFLSQKMHVATNVVSFWQVVNFVVSFSILGFAFAFIFKFLPDVRVEWKDVWIGAALTAALFTLGKLLITLYLGSSNMASAYGAAASLVALLVWVYYSAQILFFGAEFTRVYAMHYGSHRKDSSLTLPQKENQRALKIVNS